MAKALPRIGERASGVLLHLTSLPGPHGSGDLGAPARRFAEWLSRAGQRWWQMLPVGPPGFGDSPYSAESAFAGSPFLVSLEELARVGLLPADDDTVPWPTDRIDWPRTMEVRRRRLRAAFVRFGTERRARPELAARHDAFVAASEAWLEDHALYTAIKRTQDERPWVAWPAELRAREPAALARARNELAEELSYRRFVQWQFAEQWAALRARCAELGVALLGDLPIFVAHDSADVWAHPELFQLDDAGQPEVIAGVPPDYFSRTGQRWGNPLYRWPAHRRRGYAWWIARLDVTLARFDAVRLDHFIGFVRAWAIPAASPTAESGAYLPGPGAHFFEAVRSVLGRLPLVAEDLGAITPEVKALRDRFELPGIRILQFAFGDDPSAPDFVPHAYPRRAVVYTGTHDNDTTAGWFHERGGGAHARSEAQCAKERAAALDYLGAEGGDEIHWAMIRAALMSVADLAIIPAQDLLGLGSEARMNRPGTTASNWAWRLGEGALTDAIAKRLGHLTEIYGRASAS